MSSTDIFRSWPACPAASRAFSRSTWPSRSTRTTLLWLSAMWTRAVWSPAQPVSTMSSSRGVWAHSTWMGVSLA